MAWMAFLARKFEWKSRFGSIADPLADKLLLVTSFVVLTYIGLIDYWLALLVLGRDLIILWAPGPPSSVWAL